MQKVTLAKLRVGRTNSHKIVAGHFDFFVFLFAGDVVAANFVSQFRRLLLEIFEKEAFIGNTPAGSP